MEKIKIFKKKKRKKENEDRVRFKRLKNGIILISANTSESVF